MEKENKYLLLFIVIFVVALLGALVWMKFLNNSSTVFSQSVATNESSSGAKLLSDLVEVPMLSDRVINTEDAQKSRHIEVHYPFILLAQHSDLAKDANTVIAAFASDTISAFEKDVAEIDSPSIPLGFESDLSVRYTALLLSPTIISIRFDESVYIAGSAHPNNQTRILNYDMEKHILMQTEDLFASSSAALPFLSTYTREKLNTILGEEQKDLLLEQSLSGSAPSTENFSAVGISKEGLLVVLNPCQVAPCARGTIQITIPENDLSGEILPRISEAMRTASTNITEATPENNATSSKNGLKQ